VILAGLSHTEQGWILRLTTNGNEVTFRMPPALERLGWTDQPVYGLLPVEPAGEVEPTGEPCPQCGTILRPGARFCNKCGAQLGAVTEVVPEAGPEGAAQLVEEPPAQIPPAFEKTHRIDSLELASVLNWEIEVTCGGQVGKVISLGQKLTIGRMPDNDLMLEDEKVSRHHAQIQFEAGKYRVADLGSANGTFLNGGKISEPADLKPGDQVRIGDCVLVVKGFEMG
jgi:hypothetical protein